jgi:two-component system, cell cycle sensor histidine kinase and response regulator CckA
LLAFARKQTIVPKALNLNETVESMLKMLRRLIGEDVDFSWLPETDLWQIKMDPAQIEQILANLCVNARDAINDVGKITIETKNKTFGNKYCSDHVKFLPGDYVMLVVSDNGCGMDKETLEKIFDPFFTTKEVGQGTGLGLATVYGIVNQNNGLIKVYSEPGKGTTFKVYLQRHAEEVIQIAVKKSAEIPLSHGETVLVVEDEVSILKLAVKILDGLGYSVLTANTPGEAIRIAGEHTGEIDLLITDVVMPDINGWDLAQRLLQHYPNLKCLFMSGYTANVIAYRGVLDEGVHFIQKPFSKKELAVKIREALK